MSESTIVSADDSHEPFLAHHFESQQQQFDAGKLGMWLFLVTEILFFSGLFVAYAVYRSNHPEVFIDAHKYLDKTLGAVNTIVLLFSSLTMAWGVRCAQLNHRKGLIVCLAITLACASLFLGIKAVEYTHKWEIGLFWGGAYAPSVDGAEHDGHGISRALIYLSLPAAAGVLVFGLWALVSRWKGNAAKQVLATTLTATSLAFFMGIGAAMVLPSIEHKLMPGLEMDGHETGHGAAASHDAEAEQAATEGSLITVDPNAEEEVSLVSVFFSIYYVMTGIHAIHIIAGMGVIAWLVWRSIQGHFNEQYYGPVDYVGLYWHLVDMIWIYLFPLLYLIH